ncbi:mitochondrial import inner membrane translocase subunit TIM50-like [Solanum dulcamara]|uniref:mitochondrial import inner membrane translocase subunit TIM50-like n=1 Tax=Solanum dulcamara TaxID=45834 RepID=UPI0024864E55|nr:mitochondrial import inner membrane translocase subunit TIM50-like [Solanum dulcamara]
MYALARSRFRFSSGNRRILSTGLLQDQPPPPPPLPEPSSAAAAAGAENKSWNFLKYSLVATVTGGASTAGYATYAYSLNEVEEKTKALRASAKYTVGDSASGFDKFQALLYSSAMTVPAKLVELYLDLRRLTEEQVRDYSEPSSDKLLPDLHPLEQHVFTIVLDLSETLVYSDWKRERGWRTFKRPGVEDFLEYLAQFFEIVVYSDQQNMYVDPIIDRLDSKQCIRYRLSRGATKYVGGKHYRDLSMLNRDPSRIIYISGNALESSLQPENCVEIKPWKGDVEDTTLLDLIPFLEYVGKHRPADIRTVLASYQGHDIAKEFIERSKEHHRRMQEQKQTGCLWRR